MMSSKLFANTLSALKIDSYVIYDFRGSNHLGRNILKFHTPTTRRWIAIITKKGEVQFLVPKIEESIFKDVSGKIHSFTTYSELEEQLKSLLSTCKTIALDYSPNNDLAVLDVIPAGFKELIQKLQPRARIIPAAEIGQHLAASWGAEGYKTHKKAAKLLKEIADQATLLIQSKLKDNISITDLEVEQYILKSYKQHNLIDEHEVCIVATNQRASNPHYWPKEEENFSIEPNSILLFDMWGKMQQERSIYADITLMGWIGPDSIPARVQKVWDVVKKARDIGIKFVQKNTKSDLKGYQVDREVRDYIGSQGFGDYFVHRTGHAIDTNTHGSGANLDDFESRDQRLIIPDSGFSIEPGIYLPEFGIRSEVNMYIHPNKQAEVTTFIQEELIVV